MLPRWKLPPLRTLWDVRITAQGLQVGVGHQQVLVQVGLEPSDVLALIQVLHRPQTGHHVDIGGNNLGHLHETHVKPYENNVSLVTFDSKMSSTGGRCKNRQNINLST